MGKIVGQHLILEVLSFVDYCDWIIEIVSRSSHKYKKMIIQNYKAYVWKLAKR